MTKPINFHELAELSQAARSRLLTRTEADLSHILPKAQQIIDDVRQEGDKALVRFARELDRAGLRESDLAATEADFTAAEKAISPSSAKPWSLRRDPSPAFTGTRCRPRCGFTRFAPALSPATGPARSRPSPVTCLAARVPFRVSH